MDSETKQLETTVGEMRKRRETMADGKRYIIYYTFEKQQKDFSGDDYSGVRSELENQNSSEVSENV